MPVSRARRVRIPKRARKQSRADVEKALKGPLRKQPRMPPLPGMEDLRIKVLDDVCRSIAEVREAKNALRATEGDHLIAALKAMRKHEKTTWRHAGVELVRVPGEEKLRVRTSKEPATAETAEEPAGHE